MVYNLHPHLVSSHQSVGADHSPNEILTRCEQIMSDVCADFGAELREFNR